MNASQITVGASYTCRIGRNEIEVRVITGGSGAWAVKTKSGKTMTIRDAARFLACTDTPAAAGTAAPAPATATAARPSLLNAAVEILKAGGQPMNCGEMVKAAAETGRWTPRKGGKTPDRTLYSAILREITKKGDAARFRKAERGRFVLTA